MAENITSMPAALDDDQRVRQYIERLADLRSTGVTRVNDLKQQITATKKSKMLSDETKAKMIEDCRKQISLAQADAAAHKAEIDALTKEAGPGHSRIFDIDEKVLPNAVKIFCGTVYDIMK